MGVETWKAMLACTKTLDPFRGGFAIRFARLDNCSLSEDALPRDFFVALAYNLP